MRLLGLLVILAISSCACGNSAVQNHRLSVIQEQNPAVEQIQGRVYYQKFPFSGTLLKHFANGKLKAEVPLLQGKKQGVERVWYADGSLKELRFYQEGRKHGVHWGWWPHGQIKFEYHFQSGQHEGPATQWHANGQLLMKKNYRSGQEQGLQQAWGEEGELYANYVVQAGRRYGLLGSKPCYTVKGEVR